MMFSNKDDERQYKIFIQVSKTGAWEYYFNDGSLWFSAEYFIMLGLDINDYLPFSADSLNPCWIDLLHPEDSKKAIETFQSFLADKNETVYENYFRMKHSDGSWVWILSRGMKASSIESEPVDKIIGTHINITDFKEEEIRSRQFEQQLMQSQKMELLGAMASGIAHDFKNILAGILTYTQLGVANKSDNEKISKYLKQIEKACLRGDDLTRQILSYNRVGQSEFKNQDPSFIIEEVIAFLQPVLPANINLIYNNINSASILCNATQIYQLLVNLCTNAMHAIGRKPGTITIKSDLKKCSEIQRNGDENLENRPCLMMEVTDTGCGLSPDSTERIFKPFYTTKEKNLGTGLGLSIVNNIIEKHNATIKVESDEGEGTTFTMFFPVSSKAQK